MAPQFSVVVPVYNRASTVLATLQSVQCQTLRDFECIVVDDGSVDSDELKTVVEGLSDDRFRYLRRENGGESAARNTGIDEAKGEFVAFLDSDDRWMPDKLRSDAAACALDRVVFSPMMIERHGKLVGQRPKATLRRGEAISEYAICRQGFVPSSSITVPLGLARRVRWDESIAFGNDTDFALRLGAAGAAFVMLQQAMSIMNDDENPDRMSRSADWRRVLRWLQDIKPVMGERAYLAYRGWHVARLAAGDGHHATALAYYSKALAAGAFPPPLAVKALVQILVRRSLYARFR